MAALWEGFHFWNFYFYLMLILQEGFVDVLAPSVVVQDVQVMSYVPEKVDAARAHLVPFLPQSLVRFGLPRDEDECSGHCVGHN